MTEKERIAIEIFMIITESDMDTVDDQRRICREIADYVLAYKNDERPQTCKLCDTPLPWCGCVTE